MTLAPSMRTLNTQLASAVCSRSFVDLSPRPIITRSIVSRPRIASRFRSLVRPSPRPIREKYSRSHIAMSWLSLQMYHLKMERQTSSA
jgi:hypothetical protein